MRTFVWLGIGLTVVVWNQEAAQAQPIAVEIGKIEKLPKAARVPQFEMLAARQGLSDKDRLAVVVAFAAHAVNLSPHYGRGSHVIDRKQWRTMLEWAHERDAANRDVMVALLQLLLDDREYREASPLAQAFARTAPDDHAAKAWNQWCSAKLTRTTEKPLLKFPLHYCVLTRNPRAVTVATREQCLKETEIFNDSFRTLDRAPLVTFVFKSYSAYSDIRATKSELLEFGDPKEKHNSGQVTKAFNACRDPKVRDPNAINVYIFDSWSEGAGANDKTSHGVRNSNRPYLLIDWQRLGSNMQNAEPHEMGHAFGLGHVGIIGAKSETSTNIMASAAEGYGSGGQRNLGFTDSQAALILHHAQRTAERLGLNK